MNLEFKNVRVVGDQVFADHDTLNSIHLTPYLAPGSIENLMAQEKLRQIAERNEYLRRNSLEVTA